MREERNVGLGQGLFDYGKRPATEVREALKKDVHQLRQETAGQAQRIAELEKELSQVKAEEDLIRETILDAKHLSKHLLAEARRKASELVATAEKDMTERYDRICLEISELKAERERLQDLKGTLVTDLEDLLATYRERVFALAPSREVEFVEAEVSEAEPRSPDGVTETGQSKQRIVLPRATPKEALEALEIWEPPMTSNRLFESLTSEEKLATSDSSWSERISVIPPN